MSDVFARSLRAVTHEPQGLLVASACTGLGLLVAWLAWFAFARITVHEASESARMEYVCAARPVEVSVAGRVVEEHLVLGTRVRAGEPLLMLDTNLEQRRLSEERAKLAGLAPEREALVQQITKEREHLALTQQASLAAIDEARAQDNRADAELRFAKERAERMASSDLVLAQLDVLKAKTESEQAVASASASSAHLARALRDYDAAESRTLARLAELTRSLAQLDGAHASGRAACAVIEQEVELRTVRAPFDGVLGEVAPLRTGSVVKPGERVATILPSDELHVIASFAPARVAGRLHAGQRARLRFDSYPFTQYGSLGLTVKNVAREMRDGLLRAELALDGGPTAIPLQHGLTGRVEVAVEELAPALLVLRAAGRVLTPPAEPTPP
jgi:multidrug resistance efflux pump